MIYKNQNVIKLRWDFILLENVLNNREGGVLVGRVHFSCIKKKFIKKIIIIKYFHLKLVKSWRLASRPTPLRPPPSLRNFSERSEKKDETVRFVTSETIFETTSFRKILATFWTVVCLDISHLSKRHLLIPDFTPWSAWHSLGNLHVEICNDKHVFELSAVPVCGRYHLKHWQSVVPVAINYFHCFHHYCYH